MNQENVQSVSKQFLSQIHDGLFQFLSKTVVTIIMVLSKFQDKLEIGDQSVPAGQKGRRENQEWRVSLVGRFVISTRSIASFR